MEKKIFNFNEERLKAIIEESVRKFLIESGYDIREESIDAPVIRVDFIQKDEILRNADLIWDILSNSYEKIGGLKTYKNKDNFINVAKYAKVAYYNGSIIACSIYRKLEDSYKMVAIGCVQDEIGKLALQEIIKDDIAKTESHYWAEVSGAIEYYFKKYNGYPMPNIVAHKILSVDEDSLRLSTKDEVHYERIIGREWYEKMIFGIKNDDIFQQVLKAVDDYSTFLKRINLNVKVTNEGYNFNNLLSINDAIYVVENIIRAYEEDGFNELVPQWKEVLQMALSTLESEEPNDYFSGYIDYAKYLLKTMPLLELHELKL